MEEPPLLPPKTSKQIAPAAPASRFGMWPAWLVLALALGATLAMWRYSQDEVERQMRAEFDLRVTEIRASIDSNLRTYTHILRASAAFLEHSHEVTRAEWRSYVAGLKLEKNFPAIQAVAFARFVDDREVDALVRKVQASGISGFAVRPPGRREHYAINVFAEPYSGLNIKALGYDMWQDADRRVTMERARDSGEVMITQRITLKVDETSNPVPAFIMYLPVAKKDGQGILGYVLTPFRMSVLMQELLGGNRQGVAVSIHDGVAPNPAALFYSSTPQQAQHPSDLTRQDQLAIGGRTWTLSYASLPEFEALQDRDRPLRALAGGLIISLLLFLITWSLTTTRRRALLMAEEMTEASRASQELFRLLVENAPYGVALLDADDSIAHLNSAFTRIFGYRLEDVPNLTAWRSKAYPDPAYRARVSSHWAQTVAASATGAETRQTYRVRRADGADREIEFILVRLDGQRKLLTFADVTERTQMERAIGEERSKYKSLFDTANDGIFVIDKTGYVACNQQGASLYGLTVDAVVGRTPLDFSPARQPGGRLSSEVAAEKTRAVIGGAAQRFEWQCLHPDGRLLDVDVTLSRIRFGGKLCAQAIVRDITGRKQAEARLLQSEENFRVLVESAPNGIALLNADGSTVHYNAAFTKLFGYRLEDVPDAQSWFAKVYPDPAYREEVRHAWQQLVIDAESPAKVDVVFTVQRADGEFRQVEFIVVPLQDGRKLMSMTDITERQQAIAALRASEARFRSLTRLGADWFWQQDTEFRFTEVSGGSDYHRNTKSVQPIGKRRWELDYADMDAAAWRNHRESLERHETFRDFELHRIDDQGRSRFISISGEPTFDENGLFTGYHGIGTDITEKKAAIEALHLASTVYENSSEAMAVTDADSRIISVNPAFERTTGYSAAEVVGKNPRMLGSGRHEAAFYQIMWQSLNSTGHWQGEIWNRRKSGEIYLEQITINTTYTEEGEVYRRVALFSDITERKEAEELIWKQANFDALTGLPNRRMFHDRLNQEIKKAHRASRQLGLLFIDLDHFKEINDTLGHNMGDILLIEAARRIGECVRETDTVARLGGDEFTVLLTQLDDAGNVERVSLSILKTLAEPFHLGEHVMVVSASIGITLYPSDATEISALLKSADQAMYVAKKAGRNRYSYFTPALQEDAQKRLHLINDLRGAVADNQLRLHFQPIMDLASGKIHKAEALIRWQHPQRGLVSPADFIPLAEETGLIFDIGDWVFRETARWVKRWRIAYHREFQVSVNKSPVQFYKDTQRDGWLDHLKNIDLSGQGIVIEITEGLLLNSDAPIMESLLSYRDSGIQVAIDDFGTGYSSLSYLKKFDIDYLKIDQSFIRNLTPGSSDMALSEAIIVMAHKLGLKVIAEGVETVEQRDLLAAAGCDYGQGYLFSRPVPPEEFEKLLTPA